MAAKTLDSRMALASEAAAQLDLLALLPPKSSSGHHHPLSSNHCLQPPPPPRPPRDPDAMEIDAARVVPITCSLLDSSRALCWAQNLCFRCLSPIVPGVHTGSLNFPNAPVSTECRQAFVYWGRPSPPAVVSVVQVDASLAPPLTYQPAQPPSPLPQSLSAPYFGHCSNAVDSYSYEFQGL
ncbi:uncharacterized protein VP01_913g1 [Puccinia sorghi]|uniref:Uncharacterized protein n=1 Tax=Puccinia sorghi TaxID=27349 RepID=A0A0L6U7H8_9BASI|nr:uncharacterized protein VP01_913g1 [Puccinia sorghi]